MVKFNKAYYLLIFVLLCCRKPYNPAVIASPNSYLVVEGVINPGSDSTIIKLSKTVNLNSKTTVNPVLGATVSVISSQNISYPLYDINGVGSYSSPALNLPTTQQYRLKIQTSDGKQYLSDLMSIKPTPPIDSVNYVVKNGILNLYVNTHDPSNSTRYYRWEYAETWIFHPKYESDYVLDTNTESIVKRTPAQQVYTCFGHDTSTNIVLSSTAKLSQDIIYETPLTAIPLTSEKLEQRYSILVKQYALTPDAFNFYQNLKTNTEQLGSIFDTQPSEISGNIHNVNNANEPVIGYMSITNAQSVRIFISAGSILPQYFLTPYPYVCEEGSSLYADNSDLNDVQNVLINPPLTDVPTIPITANGMIIGFKYSTPICVDCTIRGTTQTPPFWK